jgi:hypothetical protein
MASLALLETQGAVTRRGVSGLGEGWLRLQDATLPEAAVSASVFRLQAGNLLVRTAAGELKRRYRGQEVLQYLLIAGAA